MAGFSEQRQQLRKALVSAGLAPDAATQIANILGNSAQALRHAGPVEIDTTPADLRMVTPEKRRSRFPNLDFRPSDPDHRPKRTADSEERREPEPEPNVVPVIAPQQTAANFRVAPGALTDVAGNGQAARVDVRNVVAGRPQAGLPMAMLDSQANQLVGKAPRARVGQNDGTARLDIQETGREVLWNLQMLNRSDYDVVTKIEYVDGVGLEITYDRIKAWDQNQGRVDTIPVTQQPIVTDVVDDQNGLRCRRRVIPVFSSRGADYAYFNTFRIGTFTGGWAKGTTKTVTHVWPQSAPDVQVVNLSANVCDSPGVRYVVFAARTKDVVPATAVRSDPQPLVSAPPAYDSAGEVVDSNPDGSSAPEVQYYALEIEGAGGDPIRIGKVSADWAVGTCATVTLWEGEASQGSPCQPTLVLAQGGSPTTVEGVRNLSRNVKANSWVAIARAADCKWYLVEAGGPAGSCRQTVGGEDITKWLGYDENKVQVLGHDANGCLAWLDTDDCQSSGGGA